MDRVFVLVASPAGDILVDDVDFVRRAGILRYEVSPSPYWEWSTAG